MATKRTRFNIISSKPAPDNKEDVMIRYKDNFLGYRTRISNNADNNF